MTWFWIIGAALVAVTLLAVLWPLVSRREAGLIERNEANVAVYRDQLRELDADLASGTLAQIDYESSRRELEARLLRDVSPTAITKSLKGKGAAIVAGIAIPVCAALIYLAVGSPGAIVPQEEHIEAMVARLAARLRDNPNDPQLLVDFADVLAMSRGRSLQGEPEQLVLRALELDPKNLKGLALAGTAAFERRNFDGAAAWWERMLPLVPPESEDARVIRENVGEARKLSASNRNLRGSVEISQKLKNRLRPDDTLFVFAQAEKGPRVPLAAMKLQARDLPFDFSLDDSMAMVQGMALSKFPRVVVTARISKSGKAAPGPGDLQGASRPVANDAQGVRVVIDTVVR